MRAVMPQVVPSARLRYLLQRNGALHDESKRDMIDSYRQINERHALIFLLAAHVVLCCVSLALLAPQHFSFHIFYDPVRLPGAIAVVAAFAVIAYVFTVAPFSFGYLLGFTST